MSYLIGFLSFVLFALFQAQHIPAGDSGDLVTAAATFGVPHPPGYPLYTLFGWIASHIPILTVVWRVGLLSSLPHAAVVAILFALVYRLSKSKVIALFSSLLLVGNYLFFLYSVTPEVFALLDFFVISIIFLVIRWYESGNINLFYLLCFVIGLSLTHHHVIFFLFPSVVYLIYSGRKHFKHTVSWILAAFSFLLGILPYVYIPIAAAGNSMVNWDRAITIKNFIQLVTRADYGSFRSGAVIGNLPVQRLLEVKAYFQYVYMDFSAVGIILICLGFLWLWTRKREFFWFFVSAELFLGPFFLFYAGFPLSYRFMLGTFERFLLPSYVILITCIGFGFMYAAVVIKRVTRHTFLNKFRFAALVSVLLFLYPVLWGATTVWKFVGYAGDRTVENMASDLLTSLPYGAVLLADRDTTLFTAEYARYVLKVRPDIMVFHGRKLYEQDYLIIIKKNFPASLLPDAADTNSYNTYVKKVSSKGLLFSDMEKPAGINSVALPYGLIYQIFTKNKLPEQTSLKDNNFRIWKTFHDPANGILSRYNHMMLSDVRDIYTDAGLSFGKALLKTGDFTNAQTVLARAIHYGGDTQLAEAYMYHGMTEVMLKQCEAGLRDFAKSREIDIGTNYMLILYEAMTYRDCVGDQKKANVLLEQYSAIQKKAQTQLKQL